MARHRRLPIGEEPWIALAALLAVGLQFQPTLPLGGSEARFSLADPFALLLAPLVVWLLRRHWPAFDRKAANIALLLAAAATMVMTYGLAVGAERLGRIETWALIKYAGWFALVYYGALGAALALVSPRRVIGAFVRVFALVHAVLLLAYIGLASVGLPWPGTSDPKMSGLIANPNAYALTLLCALGLVLAVDGRMFAGTGSSRWWELIAALSCAGVLFTLSFGALAGLAAMCVAYFFLFGRGASLLRILALAAVIFIIPIGVQKGLSALDLVKGLPESRLVRSIGDDLDRIRNGAGLGRRLEDNAKAFEVWRGAPWFGAGLGGFITDTRAGAHGQAEMVQIHNTALWLLAEFGIVGFAVFAVIFSACVVFFLRTAQCLAGRDPPLASMPRAGLLILAAWSIMSLAHEMMYQRVPWFILGMCLGIALTAPARAEETPGRSRLEKPPTSDN